MKQIIVLICWLLPCHSFAQTEIPNNKDYALLKAGYLSNKLSRAELLQFAAVASEVHEDSVAQAAALAYKRKYLSDKVSSANLSPQLQKYLTLFPELFKISDPLIKYIMANPKQSDQYFHSPGYAKNVSSYFLNKDIVSPKVKANGQYAAEEPLWNQIMTQLKVFTDKSTAYKMLVKAKMNWYKAKGDWNNAIKFNIEYIDAFGLDTAGYGKLMINNMVFDLIFTHGEDSAAFKKGLGYMEILLHSNPGETAWIDTYANLLYKAGRKDEAIKQQQKALEIAMKIQNQEKVTIYSENLQKMQRNLPTW